MLEVVMTNYVTENIVLPYFINNIPQIKELFKNDPSLKERFQSCYEHALKKWQPDDYVCKSLIHHKYAYLEDICDSLNKQFVWGNGELMKLFEEELFKDEVCRSFILKNKTDDIYNVAFANNSILHEIHGFLHNKRNLIKRGLYSHEPVKGYIRRYCTTGNDLNKFDFFLNNDTPKYALSDYVIGSVDESNNKYILYSGAQTGKTFELNNLCWELQESNLFLPISYEVKTAYSLKQNDIPNERYIEEKEIVIIIDGLDEINGKERDDLLREIASYAHDNPDIKMVLSCRSNYRRNDIMSYFKDLYLNDLSLKDVKDHINSKLGTDNILLSQIENTGIWEYIWNPFFLNVLIDAYRSKKKLPENRSDIYELFFEESYRIEKEDKNILGYYQYSSVQAKKLLQRVALAMSMMNNQFLTNEEFEKCLGNDKNKIKECERYDIIRHENDRYFFINSALREWLVANFLYDKGLDVVKTISVNSNGKVKPEWYNIIILWISMFHNKDKVSQIVEWLKSACIELVMYSEKESVEEEVRNRIFREILLEYKSLGIMFAYVCSNEHNYLMRFGQSVESVRFMINELKNESVNTAYYADLICLCKELDWGLLKIENEDLFNELLVVLNGKISEQINYGDAEGLNYTYIENAFFAKAEYVESYYNIVKDSDNYGAISSMMRLIYRTRLGDKYIYYILDKEKFVRNQHNGITTTLVFRGDVYNALSTVNSIEGIKRILKHDFKDPQNIQSLEWNSYCNMISQCLKCSVNFIKSGDKELVRLVEFCFMKHFSIYSTSYERDVNVGILLDCFKNFYKETDMFVSLKKEFDDNIENFIQENKDKEVYDLTAKTALWMTPKDVDDYYKNFDKTSQVHRKLSYWLMQCANKEIAQRAYDNDRILFQESDVVKQKRLKKEKNFNAFKDYEKFREQIYSFINESSGINYRELHKKLYGDDELSVYVYYFLILFSDSDDNINLEDAKKQIENHDFYEDFFMKVISEDIIDGIDSYLIDDECIERCNKTAEKDIRKFLSNDDSSYNIIEAIKFILRGNFSLKDDELVRLLQYYFVHIEKNDEALFSESYYFFDYLKENLPVDLLSEAIINMLEVRKIYQQTGPVLIFAEYIVKRRVDKGYDVLIQYIQNNPQVSVQICNLMLEEKVKVDEIKALSLKMDITRKLDVFNSMVTSRNVDKEWIRKNIESEYKKYQDQNLNNAIKILLRLGSRDALRYVSENESALDVDYDYTFNYSSLDDVAFLVDILTKVHGRRNYYDSTEISILNSFENIASQSKECLQKVCEVLASIALKDERFKFINKYIKLWENKDFEVLTNIEDVISIINLCESNKSKI